MLPEDSTGEDVVAKRKKEHAPEETSRGERPPSCGDGAASGSGRAPADTRSYDEGDGTGALGTNACLHKFCLSTLTVVRSHLGYYYLCAKLKLSLPCRIEARTSVLTVV
jgi:hypothetical protein